MGWRKEVAAVDRRVNLLDTYVNKRIENRMDVDYAGGVQG